MGRNISAQSLSLGQFKPKVVPNKKKEIKPEIDIEK